MPYFLELCLQSVQAALKNLEAEIIVVDNNSQDRSCELIKNKFPEVVLIENETNLGFSKGNNIGVAQASGDYVCILNPDTVVAEDTFENILNFAESQDKLGIVGCKLIDGRGCYLPESKRNIPSPKVAIQKILGRSSSYYAHQVESNEIGEVPVFVGAFMLMKRKVYQQVGGFDEDYFMYGEDIDLSYRILKAGFKNIYFGQTQVIHYKGESTLKDKTYAKRFYGAMQIFYKKHFKSSFLFDTLVWIGIRVSQILKNKTSEESHLVDNYTLISNSNQDALENVLPKPLLVKSQIDEDLVESQVIFDANLCSFKSIITQMSSLEKNRGLTYKILPKNTNFILGSNSSKSRGEVISF